MSTYIEFPFHNDLDFGDFEITEQPTGRWRVCSNRVFWALLLLGFKLGNKQDIDEIYKHLYHKYPDDEFLKGVDVGKAT